MCGTVLYSLQYSGTIRIYSNILRFAIQSIRVTTQIIYYGTGTVAKDYLYSYQHSGEYCLK